MRHFDQTENRCRRNQISGRGKKNVEKAESTLGRKETKTKWKKRKLIKCQFVEKN